MKYVKPNQVSHLSDDEIEKLIKDYYDGVKIKDIIEIYKIDCQPSSFRKILPAIETEQVCLYCNHKLQIQYLSRNYSSFNTELICPECGHEPENEYCPCNTCRERAREEKRKEQQKKDEQARKIKQEKEQFIREVLYFKQKQERDIDTLSFEERVYIGAILREGIDEGYNFIKPFSQFRTPIAPTPVLSKDITNMFYQNNIIKIYPETDFECFTDIDFENRNYSFYSNKVYWQLNLKCAYLEKVMLIDSLINPTPKTNGYETYCLWRKIALNECLEYLLHNIETMFNITYKVGDKTNGVLNDLLNEFSVGQIYHLIYTATNKALRFKEEHCVANNHAANSIIGYMQSLGERAQNDHWNLNNYNRVKECPQSLISKFFFERILRINEMGFTQKPQLIGIE